MNETPLFFNISPNKTVSKRGGESITIRTQNQEKCHISVLLIITANGNKLPSCLVFKAKTKRQIEKKLQNDVNIIKKDVSLLIMKIPGQQKEL